MTPHADRSAIADVGGLNSNSSPDGFETTASPEPPSRDEANTTGLYKRIRIRTRVRFAGHYWHVPLLLLGIFESLIAVTATLFTCHFLADPQTDAYAGWRDSAVFATPLLISLMGMGLYSRRQRVRVLEAVPRISISILFAVGFVGAWEALSLEHFPLYRLAVTAALTWALLILMRTISSRLIDEEVFKRRVLILGAGRNAACIGRLQRRADRRAFRIVGHVPLENELTIIPEGQTVLRTRTLTELAAQHDIDEIVVAMDDRRQNFPSRELLVCRQAGVEVTEMITFLERQTGRVQLELLHPSWLIFGDGFRHGIVRHASERIFDVLVSSFLLALTAPLMLVTALAIKLEDGWSAPVLYRQRRVGFLGTTFNIVKFRSMCVDAEKDGARWATRDDRRVTRVGAIIRKARIDELPQLFTVLQGKMSFVGPRPERPEFVQRLAKAIPYYHERHAVKPGLTGWAQLCYPYGASERDAREKLQYDLFYVKHHTLLFDILILLQTMEVVLMGKGAR
jgi:sugar transferase (PEP-CTERM system associated)